MGTKLISSFAIIERMEEAVMPMDHPVIRFLNKMADLIILNILFLVCCIPVITTGAAITALYHVNLRSIRYGDGYVAREFFRAFKRNFWHATIVWLVTVAAAALFGVDLWFWMRGVGGIQGKFMTVISICFAFLYFIVVLWFFPVLAKLENPLWTNVKNAAAMAVGHFFPYTIICAALVAGAAYAVYVSITADVIMLLMGFSLLTYILSFFFYKVFAKYIEEEPVGEDDPLYGGKNE